MSPAEVRDLSNFFSRNITHPANPAPAPGATQQMFMVLDQKFLSITAAKEMILAAVADGANLNDVNEHGQPFLLAALGSPARHVLVPWLLEKGADPNVSNSFGRTPLMMASAGGHHELTAVLLQHGANGAALDNQGHSAMGYANDSRSMRLLQDRFPQLESPTPDAQARMEQIAERFRLASVRISDPACNTVDKAMQYLDELENILANAARRLGVADHGIGLSGRLAVHLSASDGGSKGTYMQHGHEITLHGLAELRKHRASESTFMHEWTHGLDHNLTELDPTQKFGFSSGGSTLPGVNAAMREIFESFSEARAGHDYFQQEASTLLDEAAPVWMRTASSDDRDQLVTAIRLELLQVAQEYLSPENPGGWNNEAIRRMAGKLAAATGASADTAFLDLAGPLAAMAESREWADHLDIMQSPVGKLSSFVANSQRLDQAQGEHYWALPHELLARAVQSVTLTPRERLDNLLTSMNYWKADPEYRDQIAMQHQARTYVPSAEQKEQFRRGFTRLLELASVPQREPEPGQVLEQTVEAVANPAFRAAGRFLDKLAMPARQKGQPLASPGMGIHS